MQVEETPSPAAEPVDPAALSEDFDPAGLVAEAWAFVLDWEYWAYPLALIVGAVIVGLIVHAIVFAIAKRIAGRTDRVLLQSVIRRMRTPMRLTFPLLAVQVIVPGLPLIEAGEVIVRHVLSIGLIASVTWLLVRMVDVVEDFVQSKYRLDVSDNLLARRMQTQTRVLSKTLSVIIVIVGFAVIMMTFPNVREFGGSILASAGLAGLVVGLAARPAVANLIAGIQIALTQPIRIDDVVIVDGEWGRIEEINTSYVVVAIWDQRRLVVPLTRFIEQSFQNWTRTTADLLGTVFVYADYTVDVDAVRTELKRLCEQSDKWDKRLALVQVTDTTEKTVQLRALVSAATSGNLWDLRCHVREGLVAYLQREQPESLPRFRGHLDRRESEPKALHRGVHKEAAGGAGELNVEPGGEITQPNGRAT